MSGALAVYSSGLEERKTENIIRVYGRVGVVGCAFDDEDGGPRPKASARERTLAVARRRPSSKGFADSAAANAY